MNSSLKLLKYSQLHGFLKWNGLDFATLQSNTNGCYVPRQIRILSINRFSERPTGGVWRKRNLKFFAEWGVPPVSDRKSQTTDRSNRVPEHEHLRLTLSLNCRLILIWEIPFSPKISQTVRFPMAVNFRLYFLCRLALTLDSGFYTGGPLEQERGSG